VARAFDPSVQAAREESRWAWQMETIQFQTLTTQIRDAELESRQLRKEIHDLQRQLDRESRRADNAERDLRVYEMMRGTHSYRAPQNTHHLGGYNPYRSRSPSQVTSPSYLSTSSPHLFNHTPNHKQTSLPPLSSFAQGSAQTSEGVDEVDTHKIQWSPMLSPSK
jgi:hypothetical protein